MVRKRRTPLLSLLLGLLLVIVGGCGTNGQVVGSSTQVGGINIATPAVTTTAYTIPTTAAVATATPTRASRPSSTATPSSRQIFPTAASQCTDFDWKHQDKACIGSGLDMLLTFTANDGTWPEADLPDETIGDYGIAVDVDASQANNYVGLLGGALAESPYGGENGGYVLALQRDVTGGLSVCLQNAKNLKMNYGIVLCAPLGFAGSQVSIGLQRQGGMLLAYAKPASEKKWRPMFQVAQGEQLGGHYGFVAEPDAGVLKMTHLVIIQA